MSVNDSVDFDREGCDPASANMAAASVIRQLAAQLEQAGYQAQPVRVHGIDPAERARRLDFALVHLASVMSEMEVIGLVNALRHAASAAEEDHVCEFCGSPTQPWALLTGILDEDVDDLGPLCQHTWDQYGVTLCKSCHFVVRQARWQTAGQM